MTSSAHRTSIRRQNMQSPRFWLSLATAILCFGWFQAVNRGRAAQAAPTEIDLTRAVIVAPPDFSGPENKAVQMLIEEVERRAEVRWPRVNAAPKAGTAVIALNRASVKASLAREGYQIKITGNNVTITGNDARGVLFGVGHLLRTLRLNKHKITLPADFNVTTAPKYPLRGHQLGYRPKT